MKKIAGLFILTFSLTFLFPQTITSDAGLKVPEDRNRTSAEGFASEGFRRGVLLYYRGSYNQAIVEFEKAHSYLPNDNLILDWLGKAYYKSGMEGSALNYWQDALNNGYGGLLLENKIEIIRERRVTGDSSEKLLRLSEAGAFPGEYNGNLIFSGPLSVLPNNNGTFWISAYNSNELLLFNQNGSVLDRVTGPLGGFERPVDIIRLKSKELLLSENASDRLSLLSENGKFIRHIGSKGRGLGQMVGPLYLSQDNYERIYVSDYGNRRINVFDKSGEPLYFFGSKQINFDGLKGPTGIAFFNDSLFVADDQKGCIYEFDRSGNFIRQLVEEKTFKRPEAIKIWNNSLLVCDENKIYYVDVDTGALFEYGKTGNAPSRLTAAVPDINGNVIVSDFTANEIYVMSKIQELVGGIFVLIEHIDATAFPEVVVEIKAENRHRQAIVGLQKENFYFSENKQAVANLEFLGAASNNKEADITLIIDRSEKNLLYKDQIEQAVQEIAKSMNNKGLLRIVSAGEVPVTEYIGQPEGAVNFTLDALKNPVGKKICVDLAIRLSTNDLINAGKKRSIIYLSGSDSNEEKFTNYNLAELTAYMNNNAVGFSYIKMNQGGISNEMSYILNNTQGDSYYVFRPEGLSTVISDILDIPQGVYQLKFTSARQTNFGQNYIPLETEVYLLNRSGRDETGYFAPLQ